LRKRGIRDIYKTIEMLRLKRRERKGKGREGGREEGREAEGGGGNYQCFN